MLAAVAMHSVLRLGKRGASMMTSAPGGVPRPVSISCSVDPSATLPANSRERRTKPLPSSTKPRVTSLQSERFSLERARATEHAREGALGLASASPSK